MPSANDATQRLPRSERATRDGSRRIWVNFDAGRMRRMRRRQEPDAGTVRSRGIPPRKHGGIGVGRVLIATDRGGHAEHVPKVLFDERACPVLQERSEPFNVLRLQKIRPHTIDLDDVLEQREQACFVHQRNHGMSVEHRGQKRCAGPWSTNDPEWLRSHPLFLSAHFAHVPARMWPPDVCRVTIPWRLPAVLLHSWSLPTNKGPEGTGNNE